MSKKGAASASKGLPKISSNPDLRKINTSPRRPSVAKPGVAKPRPLTTFSGRTQPMGIKHPLEVQFFKKRKNLIAVTKEIEDKQNTALKLHETLILLKHKLNEIGKDAVIEDLGIFEQKKPAVKPPEVEQEQGAGETIPEDILQSMKTCIEEIPRKLIEFCQNILGGRGSIVELLEKVTKSETGDVVDRIKQIKTEGTGLHKKLDVMVDMHEKKVKEVMTKLQTLVNNPDNDKDSKKQGSKVVKDLEQKVKKLKEDVELQKKCVVEHKNRSSMNAQTIKIMKVKMGAMENKLKNEEKENANLAKKLKEAQDTLKLRESKLLKEKDDLRKTVKQQEQILHKITNDKNDLEIKYRHAEKKTGQTEETLLVEIYNVKKDLNETIRELEEQKRLNQKMFVQFDVVKFHMHNMRITNKTDIAGNSLQDDDLEEYRDSIASKLLIDQLKERIKELEQGKTEKEPTPTSMQEKILLSPNSENMIRGMNESWWKVVKELKENVTAKLSELTKVTSEITHVQNKKKSMEDESSRPSTRQLNKMLEKYCDNSLDLMRDRLECEKKITNFKALIEKQQKRINEMESLLKYREAKMDQLVKSYDDLVMEKDILIELVEELQSCSKELNYDCKVKDQVIKNLQEMIDRRVRSMMTLKNLDKNCEIPGDSEQI